MQCPNQMEDTCLPDTAPLSSSPHSLYSSSPPQMNDLEAQITYIAFASQENNTLRVLYKVDIKKDGEEFATGESVSAEKWSRLGWKENLDEQDGLFPEA